VCVCEREREREKERSFIDNQDVAEGGGERERELRQTL
jgi:hypothetical protein